jgi:acetyl-CoA acetyltransferase
MTSRYADRVVVAGVGQTLYEKRSQKTILRVLWEALDAALRSAGFPLQRVDGLAVTAFVLPPDNVATVAEHFGLEPRWLFQGMYGGASGIIAMLHGIRAIQAGDADVVACLTADVFDVAAHMELMDRFNAPLRDYLGPYGFGGPNGIFALHTRLYMERHGARREDFGKLVIAQRANALLNPNALFKAPLDMEQYLNARPIADPLRLYDCVLPCTGGDCVILAREDLVPSSAGPRVRVLGGGEMHNFPADDVFALRGGWERFRERMYAEAAYGPAEMDFLQLYDDYPVMEFVQLESLGFTAPGETARFLHSRDTTVRGDLPINTGGGQLSAGQAGASGGMIGVVEAMLQLRGEAGDRQVRARRGLVSGYGMVAYGRGLSCSAAILGVDD